MQKMCRVERGSLDTDWENGTRLARLPGLGPANISFLFQMMHGVLAKSLDVIDPVRTVARCGKSGGIWAPSAQKDLRQQKDFAYSN